MGAWQPDKVLHVAIFCGTDDLLLTDEFGEQDGLFADLHGLCASFTALLSALDNILAGHRLEDFKSCDNINDQI